MIKIWIIFVLLTGTNEFLFTAIEQEESIKAAAEAIEKQLKAMKADKKLQLALKKVTDRETNEESQSEWTVALNKYQAGINSSGEIKNAEQAKQKLAEVMAETLGEDVVKQMIAEKYLPKSRLHMDPKGKDTYDEGEKGVFWLFWSLDGIAAVDIALQLPQLSAAYPELNVYDCNVMRISDWLAMAKELNNLKQLLEFNDPLIEDKKESKQKFAMMNMMIEPYMAVTKMATIRRYGGYLIVEDSSPAVNLFIKEIPQCVYISKRGIVHRIKGVNEKRSMSEWVAQCDNWEKENDAVLRERENLLK